MRLEDIFCNLTSISLYNILYPFNLKALVSDSFNKMTSLFKQFYAD